MKNTKKQSTKKQKRNIDRLSHLLLKSNMKFLLEQLSNQKDYLKSSKLTNKEKEELSLETNEAIIDYCLIISSIMAKAENAEYLSFTEEDSKTMSIKDIAEKFDIDVNDFEEKYKYEEEEKEEDEKIKIKIINFGDLPEEIKKIIELTDKLKEIQENKEGGK